MDIAVILMKIGLTALVLSVPQIIFFLTAPVDRAREPKWVQVYGGCLVVTALGGLVVGLVGIAICIWQL